MPNVRLGGPSSKLQPSPPSSPRFIFGARSRYSAGTRSNTSGGSLMWQSAEMTLTSTHLCQLRLGHRGEVAVGEAVQVDRVVPEDLALALGGDLVREQVQEV